MTVLKVFRLLLFGTAHEHEWEIIRHERISVRDENDESNPPIYFIHVYALRCKKCGG
jgi:hypothetical protein